MSTESSRVAGEFHFHVRTHLASNPVGWAFPEGTGYRCFADDPTRVRKPDTSFISLTTLPPASYQPDGYCTTAPDIAVEVVSPNDLADDVDEKRDEWLAAGVKVVWVVFPVTRTVQVFRADGGFAFLRAADTLTGDPVLPGFAVRVGDLFRRPGDPRSAG